MRKLPSRRAKGKGKGTRRIPAAVPNVRTVDRASKDTARRAAKERPAAPATWTPAAPAYAPTVVTLKGYLPAARPASPNVKAWSTGAAISASKKRRKLRDDARAITLSLGLSSVSAGGLASGGQLITVLFVVTLTRDAPARYRMDDDNWQGAAKPIRDGVADAFGLRDDAPCFVWKYSQRANKDYGVEIMVEVIR